MTEESCSEVGTVSLKRSKAAATLREVGWEGVGSGDNWRSSADVDEAESALM